MAKAIALLVSILAGVALADPATFPGDPTSGLDPTKITLPKKEGSLLGIRGEADVSGNLGELAWSYQVPFPKWRGFQPRPKLEYRSSNGNGPLGQGFAFEVHKIERTRQFGVPNAGTQLSSSLDGLLSEIDSEHLRARVGEGYNLYGKADGGGYWMKDGGGNLYLFGTTKASREADGDFVSTWRLDEVRDAFGNRFVVKYEQKDGYAWPVVLSYVDQDGKVSFVFNLRYEPRTDAWTSYRGGLAQTLSQRLAEITGFAGEARSFKIALRYEEEGLTRRSLLKMIERFGATDNDVAASTTLSYSSDTIEPTTSIETLALGVTRVPELVLHKSKWLDLDGDALPDIVAKIAGSSNTDWHVWYNKGLGKGFTEPERLPLQGFSLNSSNHMLLDFDGDRKIDLLIKEGDELKVFNGWQAAHKRPEGLTLDAAPSDVRQGSFVDFDGDARVDYVRVSADAIVLFRNVSENGDLRFERQSLASHGGLLATGRQARDFGDLNGDGLPDLYMIVNQGSGSTSYLLYNANVGANGFAEETTRLTFGRAPLNVDRHRLVDVNGDGLSDVVLWAQNAVQVYLNDGENLVPLRSNQTADFAASVVEGAKNLEAADVDGDGAIDLMFVKPGTTQKLWTPFRGKRAKTPYLLERYGTSLGEVVDLSYTTSVATYAPESREGRLPVVVQVIQQKAQSAPVPTLAHKLERATTALERWTFNGGAYDAARNDFLGFATVVRTLPYDGAAARRGQRIVLSYHTSDEDGILKGRLREMRTYGLSDDHLYRLETKEWTRTELFQGKDVWAVTPRRESTAVSEKDGSRRTTLKTTCTKLYEPIMVPAASVISEYDTEERLYRSYETDYYEPGPRWRVKLPREMRLVSADSGKTMIGKRFDCHADTTKIKQIYRLIDSEWKRHKTFDYDAFGNVSVVTNALGHKTEVFYSDGFDYLPSLVRDVTDAGVTLEKRATYDAARETLTAYVDESRATTVYGYDGLGRLTAIIPPGANEPKSTLRYQLGSESHYTTIAVTVDGITKPDVQVFDGLERAIWTERSSRDGTIVENLALTGLNGLAHFGAKPFAAGAEWGIPATRLLINAYDELGRLEQVRLPQASDSETYAIASDEGGGHRPTGTKNTFYGASRTVTYNEEGERRSEHLDAMGRVHQIIEPLGDATGVATTAVAFDEADRINSVTLDDLPTRRYGWDEAHRLRTFESADLGKLVWLHDDDDHVTAEQVFDASGRAVGTTLKRFDTMGRELERRSLAGEAGTILTHFAQATHRYSFFYDQPRGDVTEQTNTAGRLAGLKIAASEYAYGYDAGGKRAYEKLTHAGKEHVTRWRYDVMGRLRAIVHPDGRELTYELNAQGLVSAASGVVDEVLYDELNRPSRLSLAGFLRERLAYDPIFDTVGTYELDGASNLFRITETAHDALGRVLARTAKALDKGESDEQYAYDARGQLQRGAIRFVPATGEPVALDEEYKWQANGLPAQRGVRSYEWRRTGAGVLESVRLADKEWTFGAFGRMVASPHVSRFGWYGEGRIACAVAGPGRSTRYSYQPDGERFASVTKDGAASETLVYVNKYVVYSKEMDAYELHHFVGERRIAQRGFDGELVYLGLDRVASARVEVTTAGAVRAHHIYDPFGAELAAAEDAAARHRFAGALHDGGSGLYQMKARHYDPELGTFVSPDSYFITKPDKVLKRTLEGDLYSYAHNAPILLSDPTGEFAINFGSKGDVKAVGMVGIEHGVVFAVNTSSGVPFMDRFSFSKYTTVSCGVATNTGVTVLGLAAGFSYGPQNVEGFGGKGLAVELGAETPIFNAGVEGGVSVGPGQLQASMGVSLGVGGFLPAEAEISVQNTYVDNALPGSVPKQGFDLVVALCSPDIKTDPPNISGLKDPSGPVATTPTIGPAR